jgi:acyl-CoA thioesterase I
LSAVVLMAGACNGASPAAPSSAMAVAATAPRVVVLGDSLALSPSRTDNFVVHLETRLRSAGRSWLISNESVSGDTTSGGLHRLDAALGADARVLIIELGANDGLRGRDIVAIERDLSTIIERAHSRGIRVLLCGMETPPSHGWTYSLEFHRLFPRLATKYNVPLVPFLLANVVLNPDMNGDDGIHPNSAGARRIAETVWPYLEPLVTETSPLTHKDLRNSTRSAFCGFDRFSLKCLS